MQGQAAPRHEETPITQRAVPEKGPRFFYGWVIVGVVFLAGIASAAWMNTGLSVFLKPITSEFGWSRSTFTAAGTVGTLAGGFSALAIGPAIDRWGAKWFLFAACLGTGILFLLLGQIHGLLLFFVLLVAGRFILQGILNVANAVAIPKWFVEQRGRATAISTLGPRLGTAVIPLGLQVIATGYGWRTGAAVLGVTAMAITVPPILLWFRRRPEDMGLLPDGRDATAATGGGANKTAKRAEEVSYTIKEALRFKGFYLLVGAFAINQFVNTGVNFNLLPYLTDQGISPTKAATIVMVWSLMGMPGVMAAGYLGERLPLRYLMVVAFAGIMAGNVILAMTHSVPLGLVFAVVQGVFFGAIQLYQTLVFADYYGRASQGAIRGAITPVWMVANSLGPLAATLVFDATGTYRPIMLAYVGIGIVVMIGAALAAPPPQRSKGEMRGA